MPTPALVISDDDRARLVSWTRSRTLPASRVERARIVLAVSDCDGTSAAARRVGVSRPTVIKWRDRFLADGVSGLVDEERSGRPKTIEDAAIIAATLGPPPESLGVTHWSTRLRELIDGTDRLSERKRAELRGVISTKPGLRRYLRVTPGGLLRIDAAAIAAETRLDGKYLIRTSDPHQSAEHRRRLIRTSPSRRCGPWTGGSGP